MMLHALLRDRDVAIPVKRRDRYHDWRSENGGKQDNVEARAGFVRWELSNGFASLGNKIETAASVEAAEELLQRYLSL
jgi:hypothetical protein